MAHWNPQDPVSAEEYWREQQRENAKYANANTQANMELQNQLQQKLMEKAAALQQEAQKTPEERAAQKQRSEDLMYARNAISQDMNQKYGDAERAANALGLSAANYNNLLDAKAQTEINQRDAALRIEQIKSRSADEAEQRRLAQIDRERQYGLELMKAKSPLDVQESKNRGDLEKTVYGGLLGGSRQAGAVSDVDIAKAATSIFEKQQVLPGQTPRSFTDIYREVRSTLQPSTAPALPNEDGVEPTKNTQEVISKTVGSNGIAKYSNNTITLPTINFGRNAEQSSAQNSSQSSAQSSAPALGSDIIRVRGADGFMRYTNNPNSSILSKSWIDKGNGELRAMTPEEQAKLYGTPTERVAETSAVPTADLKQQTQVTNPSIEAAISPPETASLGWQAAKNAAGQARQQTVGLTRPLEPGDTYINRALRELPGITSNPQNYGGPNETVPPSLRELSNAAKVAKSNESYEPSALEVAPKRKTKKLNFLDAVFGADKPANLDRIDTYRYFHR